MEKFKKALGAITKTILKITFFSLLLLALLSVNFIRLFNRVIGSRSDKKDADKTTLDKLWNEAEAQIWCSGSCSTCATSCTSCSSSH